MGLSEGEGVYGVWRLRRIYHVYMSMLYWAEMIWRVQENATENSLWYTVPARLNSKRKSKAIHQVIQHYIASNQFEHYKEFHHRTQSPNRSSAQASLSDFKAWRPLLEIPSASRKPSPLVEVVSEGSTPTYQSQFHTNHQDHSSTHPQLRNLILINRLLAQQLLLHLLIPPLELFIPPQDLIKPPVILMLMLMLDMLLVLMLLLLRWGVLMVLVGCRGVGEGM